MAGGESSNGSAPAALLLLVRRSFLEKKYFERVLAFLTGSGVGQTGASEFSRTSLLFAFQRLSSLKGNSFVIDLDSRHFKVRSQDLLRLY